MQDPECHPCFHNSTQYISLDQLWIKVFGVTHYIHGSVWFNGMLDISLNRPIWIDERIRTVIWYVQSQRQWRAYCALDKDVVPPVLNEMTPLVYPILDYWRNQLIARAIQRWPQWKERK